MKIEENQKELDAMAEFHKGNRAEGLRLQEEFAAEFRKDQKANTLHQISLPSHLASVVCNCSLSL